MQWISDFVELLKTTGDKLILLAVALAVGLSTIRVKKHETKTSGDIEAAKQASTQRYIEMLEESRADAALARADAAAARAREVQLGAVNDDLRARWNEIIDEVRARLGTAIEDVAEWKGKAEALQFEKIDLQAAIPRQRNECNEEKRALVAGYEGNLASLRAQVASLENINHDLANKLYGDGTATAIMGPKE